MKVFGYTLIGVAVSFAVFAAIRMGAREGPSTMNKEWEEASNEYLKVSRFLSTYPKLTFPSTWGNGYLNDEQC